MHSKIGLKETARTLAVCGISPSLLFLTAYCSNQYMNGALISCVICFAVSLIMFNFLKKTYFRLIDNEIVSEKRKYDNFWHNSFVIVFAILLFTQSSLGFQMYIKSIVKLTGWSHSVRSICYFISLSVFLCAYSGIESNTRLGYVASLFVIGLLFLLSYSSHKGFNTDNLYPVLGNSFSTSFLNPLYLILYGAGAPLILMHRKFRQKQDIVRCFKRVTIYVFVFSIAITLVYLLTVPHPMGKTYGNGLEAIFSCVGSGELIHRFEIFLLILYLICAIQSASFAVCMSSDVFSEVTGFPDSKPYVILLSVVLYFVGNIDIPVYFYLSLNAVTAILMMVFPIVLVVMGKYRKTGA